MDKSGSIFDLAALAKATGVTPRTIHYYIQQGLLPPAASPGPGKKYGEGHRDRLLLIKILKREHLPLAEIQRRMRDLSDEDVRRLVQMSAAVPRASSNLEYLREVIAGQDRGMPRARLTAVATIHSSAPPTLHFQRGDAALPGGPIERAQWERILVTPEVEVHLRRPLSHRGSRLVERLLKMLVDLLGEQ